MWQEGIIWGSIVPKESKIGQKWLSYCYFLPERLPDSIENQIGKKGILWCLLVTKRSKIGREMAELLPFSPWEVVWLHWEPNGKKGNPFVVYLYQKDPKSVKKWLSYGHFHPERLRDSIENHMEQKGVLWFSFVPKGSKIIQEIAESWPFST